MPARTTLAQTQATRDKIRTSQLINRLQDHIDGKVDLSATQIKGIEILIRKTLPDLKAIEGTLDVTAEVKAFGWCDPHTLQSETTTARDTSESE